jgi:RimJ/RimL family protein N-acetyltransferase
MNVKIEKTRNYEHLTFRMMSYIDFEEYKRACLASPEELTAFLSLGQYMEYYNLVDYLNLFNALLKERDTNVYGLFDGPTLVGFGTTSPANKSFGQQILYWIRNGFHGKGYGVYLMYMLICRTIENGSHFAELIIDRENIPSIKVAESLGLTKIKEWERTESGQGKRNSGKFSMYYAFDHRIEVTAEEKKLKPINLLEHLWMLEAIGVIETPKMEIRRSKFGKTRLSQNLRFFSDESERPKEA